MCTHKRRRPPPLPPPALQGFLHSSPLRSAPPLFSPLPFTSSCPWLSREDQISTVLSGIQGTGWSLDMQVQEIWFQQVYGTRGGGWWGAKRRRAGREWRKTKQAGLFMFVLWIKRENGQSNKYLWLRVKFRSVPNFVTTSVTLIERFTLPVLNLTQSSWQLRTIIKLKIKIKRENNTQLINKYVQ